MKIKTRLVIGALALVLTSLLLVGLISNSVSRNLVSGAIEALYQSKLESILALKKRQIESYLEGLRKQVLLMALDQNSGSAAFHFDSTFDIIEQTTSFSEKQNQELLAYYDEAYRAPYNQLNSSIAPSAEKFYEGMDANAKLLQYHYLLANPNPAGQKRTLESPVNEFSSYSSSHAGYHRSFQAYAENLGFGDVFLIGPNSRVNYSLNKGFELGTNLNEGPFSESGLARVFKKALDLQQGELAFEDFASYAPHLNSPAAFIATPFIKFKRIRGVMVVQFPIDTIDAIMTDDQGWSKVGLGRTGQAYLVGPGSVLRSTPRKNAEDPEAYVASLRAGGQYDSGALDQLVTRGTGIGFQVIKSSLANKALSGESGFSEFEAQGRKVLVAYAPISVEGFEWAILTEIDADEAFSALAELNRSLSGSLSVLTVLVMLVAGLLVWFLARSIFQPIERISSNMQQISQGTASLNSRLDDSGTDELSEFASSFNAFVSKLQYVVENVARNSRLLVEQSAMLTGLSKSGKAQSLEQNRQIESIDESIKKIAGSVEQNSQRAEKAYQQAVVSSDKAVDGKSATENAANAIQTVASQVENTTKVLANLEADVENVSDVLAVINSISDQTNLLALNAAIEAARAGEHGRGFAVVADEVRSLSHKIQSETHVIYETINKLLDASKQVLQAISDSGDKADSGARLSRHAGAAMDEVVLSSREISTMNQDIAATTSEQTLLVRQIEASIKETEGISSRATDAAEKIDLIGNDIEALAQELGALVAQFDQNASGQ